MSGLIKKVAGAKQYCACLHWKLKRVTADEAVTPLFKITVPGPMGLRVVMAMDTADPQGATIEEIEKLLYVVRKSIDGNFDLLNCDQCRDQSCEWHDGFIEVIDIPDPDYPAIEKQYQQDLQASSVEAVVPFDD